MEPSTTFLLLLFLLLLSMSAGSRMNSRSGREHDSNEDAHGHGLVGMRMATASSTLQHWKRRKDECAEENAAFNRFQNDGSFLQTFNKLLQQAKKAGTIDEQENAFSSSVSKYNDRNVEGLLTTAPLEGLGANQVAAKALQLQMQGKVRKAEEHLLDDDDDEYEPGRKLAKREASMSMSMAAETRESSKQAVLQAHKRIITQEERCQFCFNNRSRPKHLTISIANSCYLMLPPWEPVVDGHCLIVPAQHEGSSRSLDDDVWEELRNYKKCLLQMFAKQGREVLFMETVLNLSQQRRHCLIECIPVPPDKAKQAPLYFKKAIDEAEDEWSQHDAKKLIDTSVKGLRGSIPKNFPYFHVEFGLHGGYVHVIDNEKDFKRDFGLNVVIGMLKLPAEEMHRRRKRLTFQQQRAAALDFRKSWAPFDWTTMLD